jgi:hypothetical protein
MFNASVLKEIFRSKPALKGKHMTKFDVPNETGESTEYELSDRQLDIARRLHRAMCAQYPDRLITLCDEDGHVLATSRRPVQLKRDDPPVITCPTIP